MSAVAAVSPTALGVPGVENPEGLRIRFSKVGKVSWTSHRDVARMWERALRRSGLRVAWSSGFSPHPLLSFGLALPTGCSSMAEYLDVRLDLEEGEAESGFLVPRDVGPDGSQDRIAVAELPEVLSPLLPQGVDVQGTGWVLHGAVSLQQDVTSCSWDLEVLGVATDELAARVEQLLGAPSIIIRRERKGRTVEDDLRPSVRALSVVGGGAPRLRAELASHPRGVRPRELLDGLGPDLELARACRTHQWIERDGARWEPLMVSGQEPGADAPHAQERAS